MRSRLLTAAVGAASAVLGLSLAVPAADASPAATSPSPQVVQLGDSYSAGNGAGSYVEKTCWRSTESYGARVARELGATYRNVACSGGVVADILQPRALGSPTLRTKTYTISRSEYPDRAAEWLRRAQADQICGTPAQSDWSYTYTLTAPAPAGDLYTATARCQLSAQPQIDAVTPSTDYVFLTVGGNDIGFTAIVTQCMALRSASGCQSAIDSADSKVTTMADSARAAIAEVHRRSGGHAQVYLLGYPYLMNRASYRIPEAAPTYDAGAALTALQDKGDRVQREIMEGLSRDVRPGAFRFVDVKPSWGGYAHGVDPRSYGSNANAWLVPVLAPGREYPEWMHPTSTGWGANALALRGALS